MENMVIIVSTKNAMPEDEVNERIKPLLADGYRVASASTALSFFGETVRDNLPSPWHVYYVTTVVLERCG